MTPLPSSLWQFLGLPVWYCRHPERLPLAPAPDPRPATVLLVAGQGVLPSERLVADLRLALDDRELAVMAETAWLAAGRPGAAILLGLNLTEAAPEMSWQASLPLTPVHKRQLWSRLCKLCFAP